MKILPLPVCTGTVLVVSNGGATEGRAVAGACSENFVDNSDWLKECHEVDARFGIDGGRRFFARFPATHRIRIDLAAAISMYAVIVRCISYVPLSACRPIVSH